MAGASGEFEDFERIEAQRTPIEEAINKLMGQRYPPMDPTIRNTVMGLGPGALPPVAGIFASGATNSLIKEFSKQYPKEAAIKFAKPAMEFLSKIPQKVLDRIERFSITGKEYVKSYGRGGEERAMAGGYLPGGRHFDTKAFAPESIADEFLRSARGIKKVRGSKEPPPLATGAMPEIEVQGLNLEGAGRTAADVTRTAIHEPIHAIAAEIQRKLGHVASENVLSHGARMEPGKAALYGRNEGISYWGAKNPEEFLGYMKDYFNVLQKEGLPTRMMKDWETGKGSMLEKSIRRAKARMKKGTQND